MGSSKSETLPPPPPPPPVVPPNVEPQKVAPAKPGRIPMARRGYGTRGQSIQLLTNHYKVSVSKTEGYFFHYSVAIKYEDGSPANEKGVGRRIIDKVYDTYKAELAGKQFAYNGEKSLFTTGGLPQNNFEFTIILEDVSSNRASGSIEDDSGGRKRLRKHIRSKTYKVAINYAAKVPMQAIADALRGRDSDHYQEAVRVLDVMLRQNAAKKGCLLVRQSFFHNDPKSFVMIGDGVVGCRGFHSSFRATQGGLSLNMDVSTTMIVKPGPVIDFLIENQKIDHPSRIDWIDWIKAKRMLKNLRVKASNTNLEYKISGLSDRICRQQTFTLKQRREGDSEPHEVEITVYDYYLHHRNIQLKYSGDLPCLNVGRPKRPTYIPIELCSLVSLQRYTKALSSSQRASLVENSRQKPQERMNALKHALASSNYGDDPLLQSSGVSISGDFTRIQGRVLPPPKLRVGNGQEFVPGNGKWNFNNRTLVDPAKVACWIIVNFSARCDLQRLSRDLMGCGERKGMTFTPPFKIFEEEPHARRMPPSMRVAEMLKRLQKDLIGPAQLNLCVLSERKNSDIYGPWKRKAFAEWGMTTQCIAPLQHINDQYLTNLILKINAKLGGLNSMLTIERSLTMPLVSKAPTIIVGMDVSHGSPGQFDAPSIAAVVASRDWPLISRYRAEVRTQSSKLEMIDSLFKPVTDKLDDGTFVDLLRDFYKSSNQQKPEQIIIFRDGVSETQFNQVLNIELEQIMKACKFLDETWDPKFMVVVAQKNHHTKLFQANSPHNVPPGTVVDTGICHPRLNDFYMCAHAGMIGTSRPTHYHVLYDELGFSSDDLQELVHSLSYVYQRSTTAVSLVAPICYAHLAAGQMAQLVKADDVSERSSSGGAAAAPVVPEMPKIHDWVRNSMFFC
ncbi:protein argonaute 4A-like [Andrographis paniculata]|uniref:protein argonaute 4A-like n=1 Tax=Andrographis paniculata TaxID=175694 RepID=UPI0021E6EED3|nr:protein argonaute 4A-like [Andrographis paniculata]